MKKTLFIIAAILGLAACTNAPELPSILTLSTYYLELAPGQEMQIEATVFPKTDVQWSSSRTSVASVEAGKVTAIAEGEALITAQAGSSKAVCTVKVVDPSSSTGGTTTTPEETASLTDLLNGQDYYIFMMDDAAMARIKGTTHDFRVNGDYASPNLPADGVTCTMDIWNGDVTDANFGTCKGLTAFGDAGQQWMFWRSGSLAWGNICGGIRQWRMCDFTAVTGDYEFVFVVRTPTAQGMTPLTISFYSTTATEHSIKRAMNIWTNDEWKAFSFKMEDLFAQGLNWSKAQDGNTVPIYTPAFVINGAGIDFECCACFVYKK